VVVARSRGAYAGAPRYGCGLSPGVDRSRQRSTHGAASTVHRFAKSNEIRKIAVSRLNEEKKRRRLLDAKLTYGSGQPGVRGTCFYRAWKNGTHHDFIEVGASGKESSVQLAGTNIHELAHVLAGLKAGHGPRWKRATRKLGLVYAEAAGQVYSPLHFDSEVWRQISSLPLPSDGSPAFADRRSPGFAKLPAQKIRPCPLGIGTRGGKSRGPGSGSRLIKAACPHCNYSIWTTWKWLSKGAPLCPDGFRME
jgi:hypothetical protein